MDVGWPDSVMSEQAHSFQKKKNPAVTPQYVSCKLGTSVMFIIHVVIGAWVLGRTSDT
jgi:hypothetical protein